ncbi:hypothetical protein BegalDRAFT_1143 [Beggiatoa alba B18LD]|uniref:Uncharacterized protein n=1 Tax=Beggiatoa alba B18LD TaxID=395493 RepID=I3CEK2_9GAMM|nr:hypothetical protein [Beggiatoa alba]EIJ42045.1 hypothetical protein BegalDRAFT_1143 [Beggiatoa alba B18LD]
MGYIVVVSLDLSNATSEDYDTITTEFEKFGLEKYYISGTNYRVTLPETTFMGEAGQDSDKNVDVRDYFLKKIEGIFTGNDIRGQVFIAVGNNWALNSMNF